MATLISKFFIASMFMWIVPLTILYGFKRSTSMPAYSMTLLSGFLAVISVNIVIAYNIYMAMKEPANKRVRSCISC